MSGIKWWPICVMVRKKILVQIKKFKKYKCLDPAHAIHKAIIFLCLLLGVVCCLLSVIHFEELKVMLYKFGL